jgi:outer membrane beta-barrel protein
VHRWGTVLVSACIGATWLVVSAAAAAAQPAPTQQAATTESPAKPSDAPLPSCLDQTLKQQLNEQLVPRGVQKREFIKAHKIEIVAHGGLYGGDLTSSTWIAGGSVGYWLTEDLAFDAEFDLSPMVLDLDAPLSKFFGDTRFEPTTADILLGHVVFSPIHAKLKTGGGIVHADILLYAGVGRMFTNDVQGLSYDAGFAIELLTSKFMTVKLDIRDLQAIEEIAGQTRITDNLLAMAGIAFWIPTFK